MRIAVPQSTTPVFSLYSLNQQASDYLFLLFRKGSESQAEALELTRLRNYSPAKFNNLVRCWYFNGDPLSNIGLSTGIKITASHTDITHIGLVST